ncbi:hypothetical protein Q31b_18020 [Novipirellula aureliae]|uniref:Uncharacterized protein n=2 Tax=Novipirellula aureliae TaxID=2527966 RepID=A0A5C6E9V2_9BACT|nr:hypothetical protein Q31b_18020 [Novipirellula aureliae]
MLQAAIDVEVEDCLAQHGNRRDERGRRLVVKNGSLPEREILTGAGAISVTQGRVRDNTADPDKRVTFSPSVLPAYLRKTQAIEELIPRFVWKRMPTKSSGYWCEWARPLGSRILLRQ